MTEQQIPKLVAALVEHQSAFGKLSAEDAQWVIQKTKEAIKLFCKAVEERNMNAARVWKTIKLGTKKSVDELKTDLKKAERRISGWTNDILQKITFGDLEREIELTLISVAELGLKDGVTLKEVFNRALEIGLELCPAEVGPQLALQYLGQPLGEWIIVAMKPIAGSEGHLSLFEVGRDSDGFFWLSAFYDDPGRLWYSEYHFVFVCRK